ncbi:MAG: hypothetical protein ACLU99_04565 [Alphaproteobacteria bacterium]
MLLTRISHQCHYCLSRFASASRLKVAGIYWLPDYLKGNVSRGNDDPDKNPFDEDCEKNYNLHTTCPTPKISTGEIHVTNELTCQKKCICPSSYQYHTGNCSGSKAPTGASCNDTEGDGYLKYTQCHCTSSYPHTTATCKGEYQVGGLPVPITAELIIPAVIRVRVPTADIMTPPTRQI